MKDCLPPHVRYASPQRSRGKKLLAVLVAVTGAITASAAEGPWAIGGAIAAIAVLLFTVYDLVVRPLWRQYRLHSSLCSSVFLIVGTDQSGLDYAIQDEDHHFVKEITLQSNSETDIEIQLIPRITFFEQELYLRCPEETDMINRPRAISYINRFIENGRQEVSPKSDPEHHYTDRIGGYHWLSQRRRVKGLAYVVGFRIKTRQSGIYKSHIHFVTDDGKGISEPLLIRVEDAPKTRMRCIRREHRWNACFIIPRKKD